MHEVEVGGARTVFVSLTPAHFLKRLFIQSEAESGKFGEVSRVLHFAVTIARTFVRRARRSSGHPS